MLQNSGVQLHEGRSATVELWVLMIIWDHTTRGMERLS